MTNFWISDNDVLEEDGYNSTGEPSDDEERRDDLAAQLCPDASQVPPTTRTSDPLSHPRVVSNAIRHVASSTPLAEVEEKGLQVQQHWWWNPSLTSEDVVKLSEKISKRGHMRAGNYIMSLTRTNTSL